MPSHLYKLEGHEAVPVDNLYEWCMWMDSEELTVDFTRVNGLAVSTVFLGLAAPRLSEGPPLLFETAITQGQSSWRVVERYSTWDEAEKGHRKWVKVAIAKGSTLMQ